MLLNATTVKDAYLLPHQADALPALGGNVFFSTIDLTSVFSSEQQAVECLEMIFAHLKQHRLAPKKCHLLRRTLKFLSHIVCETGVKTDPDKVQALNDVQKANLMEGDSVMPKIRFFLSMVLYYQHFIEDCSAKVRPLFRLCSEQ